MMEPSTVSDGLTGTSAEGADRGGPTATVSLVETISWPGDGYAALVERAGRLLESPRRSVLGIAGAPASGKSTLALVLLETLQEAYPGRVALVGMDAFHLSHRVLESRGLNPLKGAPHTYDVEGYVALLDRILTTDDVTIFAPEFHREIEDSIAHEVEIGPEVDLVITEGNYLLLPDPRWGHVRELLSEAWYVHLDDALRRKRLTARHEVFGLDADAAAAKALGGDEANAALVSAAQNAVDVWIDHVEAPTG